MAENVIKFSDDNFDAEVLQADVPVLVDFWAEWCGPCRMLAPVIEEIAGEFDGKAKVGKLDTDANQKTSAQYGVTAIPTLIVFKGGEVAKQMVGLQSKASITEALDAALS